MNKLKFFIEDSKVRVILIPHDESFKSLEDLKLPYEWTISAYIIVTYEVDKPLFNKINTDLDTYTIFVENTVIILHFYKLRWVINPAILDSISKKLKEILTDPLSDLYVDLNFKFNNKQIYLV